MKRFRQHKTPHGTQCSTPGWGMRYFGKCGVISMPTRPERAGGHPKVALVKPLAALVIAIALVIVPSIAPVSSVAADPGVTTFTTLGDSHTTGDFIEFDEGLAAGASWTITARSDTRAYVGGWARGGATTSDMLAHAEHRDANWLVLMVGTNDPGHGVTWAQSRRNILEMVKIVGADQVLLSAIPPRNRVEQRQQTFNGRLHELALEQGFSWINPWGDYRTASGGWISGMTVDGTHAKRDVYRAIGRVFGQRISNVAPASIAAPAS